MCLLTISVLTNILNHIEHIEVKVCSEMHLSINNTFLIN